MRARATLEPQYSFPVRMISQLADFDAVIDDGIDGVIWNRQVPATVETSLKTGLKKKGSDGRFCVPTDKVASAVVEQFKGWGWPIDAPHQWLAGDIEVLALRFADILSVSSVNIRIEQVRDDACRKFHRDALRARLICTYSGPGTELAVLRDDDEQPRDIDAVPTGCPVLLKGKHWPGPPSRMLVHRSPPIEGTGTARLVVVIDELI